MDSYNNEYIVSSNNSINENNLNAKKAQTTIRQIKQLLKSLIKKCKKNTCKKNIDSTYFVDEYETEIDENLVNEMLEAKIFEEVDGCDESAAVPVYNQGRMDIIPVFRGQKYIPVHFARTEAGTFFWTSMNGADSDISCIGDKNAITKHQLPTLQVPCDRWAQA